MHGVCVDCLESNHREIKCRHCFQRWSGAPFQIGTLNSFDIFACAPCCGYRISCKNCKAPVLKKFDELQHFSQYSDTVVCKKCKSKDYHLVKPSDSYEVIYKPEACVVTKTGGIEVKSSENSGGVRPKRLVFGEGEQSRVLEQSFGARVVGERRSTFSVRNNFSSDTVRAKILLKCLPFETPLKRQKKPKTPQKKATKLKKGKEPQKYPKNAPPPYSRPLPKFGQFRKSSGTGAVAAFGFFVNFKRPVQQQPQTKPNI